jgi:hypothetical protein
VEGVQRLGGVGDAGLALAVVAEAGHLEDGRVEAGIGGGDVGVRVDDREGAVGRPLSRRKDFSAMRFWHTATAEAPGRTGTNLAR